MTEVYSEEDGVKYDAHIHEPILREGSKRAERREQKRLRKRAKEHYGMTDEQIERALGKGES
jgi:hypothetical protein